ncbi:TPA: hypothetical protein R1721_000355 [Campylobacter lari]|nr:hypothetical protein [Campylobacter lari]
MNEQYSLDEEKKKQVIGLYGEMQLAMKLHNNNWQVHRSYIDEGIDFVISKYYCKSCGKFSKQLIKQANFNGKKAKCVTNLCEICKNEKLSIITKYLQVKTSEGKETKSKNIRNFSFHPKIRYDMDNKVYYVWIAVFENKELEDSKIHYYIFHSSDISKFDDINLDTYQIADNQKTTLKIDIEGNVLNQGKKYHYGCFKIFHNNFQILEKLD